jgi:hypothetical protein
MGTNYYLKENHKCNCKYCGYSDKHLGKFYADGMWCSNCNVRVSIKRSHVDNMVELYCAKCHIVQKYREAELIDYPNKPFEYRPAWIYAVEPIVIKRLTKKDMVINEGGISQTGLQFKKDVENTKNKHYDSIGIDFS